MQEKIRRERLGALSVSSVFLSVTKRIWIIFQLPMDIQTLLDRNLTSEFTFSASRSSGPGGQNVNKVNTRAEIRFSIRDSALLSDSEKQTLLDRLSRRINSEGELLIISQSERSQLKNRKKAVEKMLSMIAAALTESPERIPTGPTTRSKAERLDSKRKRGNLKELRKGIDDAEA
jgi:ribosome-associated protein